MKKLLLVLLVVALAAFLFVGCIPTTPGEGEGEGEGEAEICPTVHVTSQVAVGTKTYIKGGKQTITVTFAVPTEPVSVYVGSGLKVTLPGEEVVMYPNATKTVYTGTFEFGKSSGDCGEAYIYVETCGTCTPCPYPYIVDTGKPSIGKVEICVDKCTCAGCELTFTGQKKDKICGVCGVKDYCEDCCSGFASWTVEIYKEYPFKTCCDIPCLVPLDSGTGTCQVDFTTTCLEASSAGSGTRTVYALVTLLDNVGNKRKMLTAITFNPDTCDSITLDDTWASTYGTKCAETGDFVVCKLVD